MSIQRIAIEEFIEKAPESVVFDVRSPKEYQQAHYQTAYSLPLFTDDERAEVGTIYKQKSREKAIKKGLDFFGPKMKLIVDEAEGIVRKNPHRNIIVHCWRGGMRSAAIAWLLDLYGFPVSTLEGGYKKIRNWVLQQFEEPYDLRVLGGFTGSGKTEILQYLAQNGHLVVDLEGLARHRGSAFGNLDRHPQDSTEQFENNLALTLFELKRKAQPGQKIWIESESNRIGNDRIPHLFFNQMKEADRVNIEIPFEKRLDFIVKGYGEFDKEALMEATKRIKKRLGGLNMQRTIEYIAEGNLKEAFRILLQYYDKAYEQSSQKFNPPILSVELPDTTVESNTRRILEQLEKRNIPIP